MATALLVVFTTGLISVLVLLLTFRLTRANEHHKWLREKRFEVYTEFLAAIEEARHRSTHGQEELDSALLRYETALDAALLLAGPRMLAALERWMEATESEEGESWHKRAFSEMASYHEAVLTSMDEELEVPQSQ